MKIIVSLLRKEHCGQAGGGILSLQSSMLDLNFHIVYVGIVRTPL